MYKLPATFFTLFLSVACFAQAGNTLHDFSGRTILGEPIDFSMFYGKKVMVVNTATYCSWTYQYEALQDLYNQYKDSNFTIIGYPCNDFSNQEPGSDSTINEFCDEIYGITFQMMSKVAVVSHDTASVYKWLQRKDLNGVADVSVNWNFNKFLIDEAGHWVAHYNNITEPDDAAIIDWITSKSVLSPTGIQELTPMDMKIHSNEPGRLSVSFNEALSETSVIKLFSLDGRFLSSVHDGLLKDGEVVDVDLNSSQNGIYFLQVSNERESRVFKIATLK